MNEEVLSRYIRSHFEASDGRSVFFSWHGGEPLLAGIDFYRRVVEMEKRMAPEGCVITNGIQTNATLIDDEWGAFLKEEGFYAGVSIDGPERFHDLNRKRAGGSGTFNSVLKGIETLRAYGVQHELLCVVSSDNVSSPLEVYRFLKGLGAGYISFLPLVERQGSRRGGAVRQSREGASSGAGLQGKGAGNTQASAGPGAVDPEMTGHQPIAGVTDSTVGPVAFGRFLSAVFDEWIEQDIGRVKVQVFEEALRSAFGQEHTLCIFRPECGAVPVVEMNGDFYSCDHFVDEGYRIGNIMERSLASLLDDPRQIEFGRAKKNRLPRWCLDCEVLEMCNGECPKNRFITAPDGEPGLNYLCKGYRYFFNHCRPFADAVAGVWKNSL
jgi:uncharacterized protein